MVLGTKPGKAQGVIPDKPKRIANRAAASLETQAGSPETVQGRAWSWNVLPVHGKLPSEVALPSAPGDDDEHNSSFLQLMAGDILKMAAWLWFCRQQGDFKMPDCCQALQKYKAELHAASESRYKVT